MRISCSYRFVPLALAGLLTAGLVGAPGADAQLPTPPCRVVDTRGNGFTGPFGPPALKPRPDLAPTQIRTPPARVSALLGAGGVWYD